MHPEQQANCIAATLSKDYPDAIRLANLCDSGLVNQMAFLLEQVPGSSPKLAVLSCPFPIARGTEGVFAGSLGDSMDIICPVTIRMRDVKGQCFTLASAKRNLIRFNLPTLGTDSLLESGPDPVKGTFAEPSGQDCLGLAIKDPSNEPCIILLPKVFPLGGGYSIPSDTETTTIMITATICTTAQAPPLEEFTMWYEAMLYGITNLGNYSIQARNFLFAYAPINKVPIIPETNLVTRFTTVVTFLTPNNPLYQYVITSVLATKTKAFASFGSKSSMP